MLYVCCCFSFYLSWFCYFLIHFIHLGVLQFWSRCNFCCQYCVSLSFSYFCPFLYRDMFCFGVFFLYASYKTCKHSKACEIDTNTCKHLSADTLIQISKLKWKAKNTGCRKYIGKRKMVMARRKGMCVGYYMAEKDSI